MIGISIYPYKENIETTLKYIEKAAKLGYKRVFLNLLVFDDKDIDKFLNDDKAVLKVIKENNMEVYVDVNPEIFKLLGIKDMDLKFFYDLGIDGIRLDGVFNGDVEAELTYNEYDLKIELNASQDSKYIENIIKKRANVKNLISCHNFYPQRYSGLTEEFYVKTSKISKKQGLRLAAFVSSNNNAHGPHMVDDNLPTLEIHRDLDMIVQAKHFIALSNLDDIIISNAYASDEELSRLAKIYKPYVLFNIDLEKNISENEMTILKNRHSNRADMPYGLIRSSLGRVKYKNLKIEKRDSEIKVITRGTVYMCNENFGQYKGEIAIALEDLKMDMNRINVLGKIVDEELFLLEYIKDNTRFGFEI